MIHYADVVHIVYYSIAMYQLLIQCSKTPKFNCNRPWVWAINRGIKHNSSDWVSSMPLDRQAVTGIYGYTRGSGTGRVEFLATGRVRVRVEFLATGTGRVENFCTRRPLIYRVHPNKSPLKICEKMERGRIPEVPKFSGYPYYLSYGRSCALQILHTHL